MENARLRKAVGELPGDSERMRPFRSLVDTAQEYAVLGLDGDGTVDAWTEAAADLTGYDRGSITGYDRGSVEGAHVSTLYADGEAPDGVPESDLLATAEAGRVADDRWLLREDGSSFRARLVVTLVREASGDETSVGERPSAEMLSRRQITVPEEGTSDLDAVDEPLTDRQHAALQAAYHAGFFEWPRGACGVDVASSLDVSPPTFHQHLRKAMKKVFDTMLS